MRTLLSLLLAGILGAGVVADASGSDAEKIDRLIQQLGANTYAEREAASKALDALGEPALDALRKATRSKDAEVRKRAGELVTRIDSRLVRQAVLKPTMVHLKFKDEPIDEAVRAFAKQSGYDLVFHDGENKLKDKKITLDTGKVTFWKAMERFCETAGVVELDPNLALRTPGPRTDSLPRIAPMVPPGAGPAPPPVPPPAPPPPRPPAKKPIEAKVTESKPGANPASSKKEEAKRDTVVLPRRDKPIRRNTAPWIAPRPTTSSTGGGFYVPVPTGRIILIPGSEQLPADTSSSIRVRLANPTRFPASRKSTDTTLSLEVSTEPQRSMVSVNEIKITQAFDTNDRPLKFLGGSSTSGSAPTGTTSIPSSNRLHLYPMIQLANADNKLLRGIKKLQGTLAVNLLTNKAEMIVVESPEKSAGKLVKGKLGGSIEIEAVKKNADGSIRIEFTFDPPAEAHPEARYDVSDEVRKSLGAGPPLRIVGGVPLPAVPEGKQLYAPWGLTLQNDKGQTLLAAIRPDRRSEKERAVREFVAVYLPDKEGKFVASRMVFTGRRQVHVEMPFELTGISFQ